VTDIDVDPVGGTGIVAAPKEDTFLAALHRALALYADPARYARVQRNAMLKDFSWTKAVAAYEKLYSEAL
jgi:starch synthase